MYPFTRKRIGLSPLKEEMRSGSVNVSTKEVGGDSHLIERGRSGECELLA